MTSLRQKNSERYVLDQLLAALGRQSGYEIENSETPDFIISICGRREGVEITSYHNNGGKLSRRAVEEEWKDMVTSAEQFCKKRPEIGNVAVMIKFKARVPGKKEQGKFLEEIQNLICVNRDKLRSGVYRVRGEITSELMSRYVDSIHLREVDGIGKWDKAGNVIDLPAVRIASIIKEKSDKNYLEVDELWLVIYGGCTPSGMILLPDGLHEFMRCVELCTNLELSRFSRVYVFSKMGLFGWDRVRHWQEIQLPLSYLAS